MTDRIAPDRSPGVAVSASSSMIQAIACRTAQRRVALAARGGLYHPGSTLQSDCRHHAAGQKNQCFALFQRPC